jgi:hypothetical protein
MKVIEREGVKILKTSVVVGQNFKLKVSNVDIQADALAVVDSELNAEEQGQALSASLQMVETIQQAVKSSCDQVRSIVKEINEGMPKFDVESFLKNKLS